MKRIYYIDHAVERQSKREIPHKEIETALSNPDKIEISWGERSIYMRIYFDKQLEQNMLLRVIVEEKRDEFLVISVYKTSKITKYLQGDK